MKEYIERDAAMSFPFANGQYDHENADPHFINGCESYREWLEAIPAADVVPVKHGRWVWNPDGMDWGLGAWCCSECKSKAETWWANDKKYNPLRCSGGHFCGNCGARMDGDGE